MVFNYYNGEKDLRPCISTHVSGSICKARMVNPDYSIEEITYDDYEYGREARIGEPIIDADDSTIANVRAKHFVGSIPYEWRAKIGDMVKVVKGRKYPIGETYIIKEFTAFRPNGTYGHCDTTYIITMCGKKINANNCVIEKVKGHVTPDEYPSVIVENNERPTEWFMNQKGWTDVLYIIRKRETAKAVLSDVVKSDGSKFETWIPKSQIRTFYL